MDTNFLRKRGVDMDMVTKKSVKRGVDMVTIRDSRKSKKMWCSHGPWLGWIPGSYLSFCEDFYCPNSVLDSVSDAESHDIKILTWFPGNLILEILIKIYNCVGSANIRGRFWKVLSWKVRNEIGKIEVESSRWSWKVRAVIGKLGPKLESLILTWKESMKLESYFLTWKDQ